MKIIVTGAKGQLGYDIVKELKRRCHEVVGIDKEEMDITSSVDVEAYLEKVKADAVIHCAAYTAVDAAEDNEETARKVNAEGTKNIACTCRRLNMKMMYISTDYVFNGGGEIPWKPDDVKEPLNAYGRTKYEGELEVEKYLERYYIVRISWVFGINGSNFVKTMLKLGRERGEVKVVNDQTGSPTYTKDLSSLLSDMIESDKYGAYHASNEGLCSWYDFACEIFKAAELKVNVIPVGSNEFPAKAERPKNSRMNKDKLKENGFMPLRHWREALKEYITELNDINA